MLIEKSNDCHLFERDTTEGKDESVKLIERSRSDIVSSPSTVYSNLKVRKKGIKMMMMNILTKKGSRAVGVVLSQDHHLEASFSHSLSLLSVPSSSSP